MAKLNQILAIEKGIKSESYAKVGELDKLAQKPELFVGHARIYASLDVDGEKLPDDHKRVQLTVDDLWRSASRLMSEHFDVTARKDWSNCSSTADIVVDEKTVVSAVPVTYLLFLEKQLTDLRTMVGRYPVLDTSEEWERDANAGLYKTESTRTHRTKKIQKPIVLLQPTEHHPGQAELITEDVIAGYWTQVKHSGALPGPRKRALLERIDKVVRAVKRAREEANSIDEVKAPAVGDAIFDFLTEEE